MVDKKDEKSVPLTEIPKEEDEEAHEDHEVEIPSAKMSIRNKLYEMVATSTINGLSQALSAKLRVIQIFWSLVFIFAMFEFSWNIYFLTVRYRQEPILSQIDPTYTPFSWPEFTLCNPSNPIPFWAAKDLEGKWKELMKASNITLPRYGLPNKSKPIWEQYVAMSSLDPAVFFAKGVEGSFHAVAAQFDDPTIASSSSDFDQFEKVDMDQNNPNGPVYATLDSIRAPLPCYRIKPRDIAAKRNVSLDRLLTLKLYLIMDLSSYKFYDSGFENRKVYFYITNENATIQSVHPFYVEPGTSSFFSINEKKKDRVKGCRKSHFPVEMYHFDMSKVRQFDGSFDDCRFHLSQSLFVRECGCYNTYLPIYKFNGEFPRVCTNMSHYDIAAMTKNVECMNRVLKNTMRTQNFELKLNSTCNEYKKRLCTSSTYSMVHSSNVWPKNVSESRKTGLLKMNLRLKNAQNGENLNTNFLYENLAIVELYKSKESVERTHETYEYPWTQYMSDIGGLAGLWIGLSMISLFELVEMIITFISYLRASS